MVSHDSYRFYPNKWCAEGDNQHFETFINDQDLEKVTKSHFIMMVSIKNISQKSFLLLLMVFSALIVDTEAYNIHSYSKKCRVGLSEAQKACSVCKWYNISRESLPMRIQHVCFHLHKNQCCSQIKNQYLNWLNWNFDPKNRLQLVTCNRSLATDWKTVWLSASLIIWFWPNIFFFSIFALIITCIGSRKSLISPLLF